MNFFALLAGGATLMFAMMTLVWWFARRIHNFSIIDVAWCFGFTLLNGVFSAFASGWSPRRWLVFAMVTLWSMRLGLFILKRVANHHPQEDGRYTTLRKEYGNHVDGRFFLFFQTQGISIVMLSVPFLFAFNNPANHFHILELGGAACWLVSWLGESISDYQMQRFKMNPLNRGKTCQTGLWNYSRHPNYFFEICVWFSYYLFALGTSGSWFTLYCPLFMLFLIVKVTGIPLAEAQALRSRGEEYRNYQRRTSKLIPWFPKKY